ncbi:MAG: thiamine phosphate synthase [Hymenobacteraceae bacterium]|nr:thiamine phosphate synthase [Hymenobacteraceae bacterium]
MKLLVITAPENLPNETELICGLIEQGLETLHVRKPGFSEEELRAYVEQLPEVYHNRLVLHSHHQLKREFNLKGLHFPAVLRSLISSAEAHRYTCSTSCHSLEDLQQASSLFDYAFLSPVFDSISKKGYKSAFAEDDLKSALQQTTLPVVALGGINCGNIHKTKALGFDGAAVLGAVWDAKDPVKAFVEFIDLLG